MPINKLRMNFKRTGLFILLLSVMFKTSTAIGCCAGDPVTLTELLVSTTDQRAILVVTIDSSWTDQHYGFWSIATVNKVYKHAPEKTQITIVSGSGNSSAGGHLTRKGEQYLLVSGTRDGTTYGGFVCDKFSRRLQPNYPGYRTGMDQMVFIKEYFEKVNNKFTGPVRLEYDDKVYMEGFLKDGIPHGDFKHYETIPYGKYKDQHLLSSQATYVYGKLNGKTIGYRNQYRRNYEIHNFYSNGILLKTETWIPGKTGLYRSGFTEYTDQGDFLLTNQVSSTGEDTLYLEYAFLKLKKFNYTYQFPNELKNIPHGVSRKYSKTGVLLEEGNFFWGARTGQWTWYHEDATIRKDTFYKIPVRSENLFTIYHPEGAIKAQGKMSQGLLEGIWKYYRKNGEFHFQNFYKEGLLNGVVKKISREYSSEYHFVNGKKHGTGKYFRNGKLSSTENYKDGKKDGLFKSYGKTGIVRSIASYQDGQLHGVQLNLSVEGDTTSLKHYTNGYLDGVYRTVSKWRTEEGTYDMGFRVGVWKTYNARKEFYSIYDYGYEKGTNMMHQQHMIHDQIIYQDSKGNILSPEDVRDKI